MFIKMTKHRSKHTQKSYTRRKNDRYYRIPHVKPSADQRLRPVFEAIGVPEPTPFKPDRFQLEALDAIQEADCLVTAPTGSGKTWIAEQAIAQRFQAGQRAWYASPLKALTNSKYREFGATFGLENVGILTGDRKENPDAPIIVGTTEILRNQLYDAMHLGQDVPTDFVILDEAHYLGNPDRGVVWEEVMIYLPSRVPLLMLSATVGNAGQIAQWLASIRDRPCAVVQETQRPVDLEYLFLHPSGKLMPLLFKKKKSGFLVLDHQVRRYIEEEEPPLFCPPNDLPPFGKIIDVLGRYHLLPAIFFLKSRRNCDRALERCSIQDPERLATLHRRIDDLLEAHPNLAQHPQIQALENRAVGAHHAGQLPVWKMLLETLMTEGLLDAIFATSTVAAGVNFPARTVVILNSDRFNGQEFIPLSPTEFHQMTGRAGRRGMDHVGFAVALPGRFMNLESLAKLAASAPSPVLSQLQINFSMVLNLLLSHTPEQIETLLERSFAAFLKGRKHKNLLRRLVKDFDRRLAFLSEKGYTTIDGDLTEVGRWASQLRVDQPLLIAECLRRDLLPVDDPALLAAIVASFVNERETDEGLNDQNLPKPLVNLFMRLNHALNSFMQQMIDWHFDVRALYLRPAITMYLWASGRGWAYVVARSKMAEGDLAMMILRTADNLRHIATLHDVFPQIAATAGQAVDAILREPVIMDEEL
jgi:ATP-dependent RNA helicase HelY